MASRILIVDEHRLMRDNVRTLIESHPGWEVCGEAEDGEEAVTQAATLSPDAIILALAMPRMNGFEAACQIHKTAPRTPIILHTMYSSPAVAQMMGRRAIHSGQTELIRDLLELLESYGPTWHTEELDTRVRETLTRATLSTESSQGTKPH